ncbi:MAG TPA: RodZ domain-containing protein [Stellaceae bacterium]|nr:RodZ domain-containing protein [Stellaceae bacterium]
MALFTKRKGSPDGTGPDFAPEAQADTAIIEPRSSRRRTVGQLLRETRESYGNDIERIAAALRIRGSYLEAIEAGQYDRLPGPVYALGFVRAYAAYLGLDGDEAVRRFKLEAEGFDGQRDLSFPVPLAQRSIPGGAMLLVALILAICGYGLWYYLSSSARPRPERVAAVPAQLAPPPLAVTPAPAATKPETAPAPAPVAGAMSGIPPSSPQATASPPAASPPTSPRGEDHPSPAAAPSATAASPPPAPPAAPAVTAAPEKPEPPPVPDTVAAAPPAAVSLPPPSVPEAGAAPGPNEPHVYGLANGETRIVIRAVSDSWVQVRDRDHVPLFTRQLHTGDSYHVPDRPGLTMRTGKGAGLAITVDGRQTPPIGGAVRPNVMLEPDRLLAGTAVVAE